MRGNIPHDATGMKKTKQRIAQLKIIAHGKMLKRMWRCLKGVRLNADMLDGNCTRVLMAKGTEVNYDIMAAFEPATYSYLPIDADKLQAVYKIITWYRGQLRVADRLKVDIYKLWGNKPRTNIGPTNR